MIISKSILLHCIKYALEEDFRDIFKKKEADEQVRDERQQFLKNYSSVCMQENPGINLDVIESNLTDGNIFLDPKLYYRAIEEFYEINLFTLIVKDNVLVIEPPNFVGKYMKFKAPSKRPTIIITKLFPAESDCIKEIQCELIITGDNDFTFDKKVRRIMDLGLRNIVRTTNIKPVISFVDNKHFQEMSFKESNRLTASNLRPIIKKYDTISQWIDSSGKLRCINIEIRGESLSIITDPLQPLNLPIETPKNGKLSTFEYSLLMS